ncbi:hypothetical protein RYX36_023024 [Vicia faba]
MTTEKPIIIVELVLEPATAESLVLEKVKEPKAESEKTKKTKESKPKKALKPRNHASHPTYEEMIKDAIVSLKEKNGSNQYAIEKFIEEKHKQLP